MGDTYTYQWLWVDGELSSGYSQTYKFKFKENRNKLFSINFNINRYKLYSRWYSSRSCMIYFSSVYNRQFPFCILRSNFVWNLLRHWGCSGGCINHFLSFCCLPFRCIVFIYIGWFLDWNGSPEIPVFNVDFIFVHALFKSAFLYLLLPSSFPISYRELGIRVAFVGERNAFAPDVHSIEVDFYWLQCWSI